LRKKLVVVETAFLLGYFAFCGVFCVVICGEFVVECVVNVVG